MCCSSFDELFGNLSVVCDQLHGLKLIEGGKGIFACEQISSAHKLYGMSLITKCVSFLCVKNYSGLVSKCSDTMFVQKYTHITYLHVLTICSTLQLYGPTEEILIIHFFGSSGIKVLAVVHIWSQGVLNSRNALLYNVYSFK